MNNIKKSSLDIGDEMRAFDLKDRDYWDNFTEEDRKKFSNFMMIRWGSCVEGSPDMQMYYLQSTNEKLNKNFFAIPKQHDKLNWLAATTVSPGMGKLRHNWIKQPSKDSGGSSKIQKFLTKLYPDARMDELILLEKINDPKVWKDVAKELGWTQEQIKKEL